MYWDWGDPIPGTTTLEAVQMLMADFETEGIIMIGEIGEVWKQKLLCGLKIMALSLLLDLSRSNCARR